MQTVKNRHQVQIGKRLTTNNNSFNTDIISILSKQVKDFDDFLLTHSRYLDKAVVYVVTDSEWARVLRWLKGFKHWLQSACLVVYYDFTLDKWCYFVVLFTSTNISSNKRRKIVETFPNLIHIVQSIPEHASHIESVLADKLGDDDKRGVQLVIKYSPLDLHAYFGEKLWLRAVDDGNVEQKRSIKFNNPHRFGSRNSMTFEGLKRTYSIRDIHGLCSKSLAKQAASVNVKMHAKKSMDKYKDCMWTGYNRKPLTATVYNLTDTFGTFMIALAYLPLVNELMTSIGLPDETHLDVSTLPHTTGSLVAHVFETFVWYYPMFENPLATAEVLLKWRLTLWKHSIKSDNLSREDSKLADDILVGMRLCSTLEQYQTYEVVVKQTKKKTEKAFLSDLLTSRRLMSRLFTNNLYQQASSKFTGLRKNEKSSYSALVQGGRCNNSNPYLSRLEKVLDIDLNSCYGSCLRKLVYPVGLPKIRAKHINEPREKWRPVYENVKHDLVDDVYCFDVSTSEDLSFEQDLIYSSRGLTLKRIYESVLGITEGEDEDGFSLETIEDVKKIPNDFVLNRTGIEHGRLCASTIRTIMSVSTNKELGELSKKLETDSLIFYPKSQMFTDLESFCDHMLADKGSIRHVENKKGHSVVVDDRTRDWYPVKLELFVGKLVDIRGGIKKQSKTAYRNWLATGDSDAKDLYDELDAKQDGFKLFINTLYGVLASVYFTIGNVVLANVITDKARNGAWMLSKALRTICEITDGGLYTPYKVAFVNGKLPGLQVISDFNNWSLIHRSRSVERTLETLGGLTTEEWDSHFESIDALKKQIKVVSKQLRKLSHDNPTYHTLLSDSDTLNSQLGVLYGLEDKLAFDHIKTFWSKYSLEFEYSIEHKYEHASFVCGYLGKSDYYLEPCGGDYTKDPLDGGDMPVFKKRGSRFNPSLRIDDPNQDPAFHLLQCLAHDDTSNYVHHDYPNFRLVKIKEYQNAKLDDEVSDNPSTLSELKTSGFIVPGHSMTSVRLPRQLNNKHIYLKGDDMIDSIKKRKGLVKGERLEWFEKYVHNHKEMLRRMNDNDLRPDKYGK